MNWLFSAVAMGLCAFLAEIFWCYRRDNSLAHARRKAMKVRVEKTERSLEKARGKIDATQIEINSLKEEKEQLKTERVETEKKLEEMEAREERRKSGKWTVDRD